MVDETEPAEQPARATPADESLDPAAVDEVLQRVDDRLDAVERALTELDREG